jgi:LysR family nitrogen assimilation transcriptional regulator
MNKETIELRHLRYFAAFCESGGTLEAAKRLGVAPTTVKRSIRELELLLNVKLLVRGSRALTDSGKLMRTHANNVLKYLTVAMEALRSGNEAQPKGIV